MARDDWSGLEVKREGGEAVTGEEEGEGHASWASLIEVSPCLQITPTPRYGVNYTPTMTTSCFAPSDRGPEAFGGGRGVRRGRGLSRKARSRLSISSDAVSWNTGMTAVEEKVVQYRMCSV